MADKRAGPQVDANIPTGTIFGVYEEKESMENCVLDDDGAVEGSCLMNTLQPGDSLVASGYCLYSSSCMFVFTVGSGLQGFTYDRAIGEFVLTHRCRPSRSPLEVFSHAPPPTVSVSRARNANSRSDKVET